ncbi:MAG: hypothetical protein ACRD0O_11120 [Acidimicrobiia bacterium]
MAATVFLCGKCAGHRRLGRALDRETLAPIVKVGCQKVCHGPVAGLAVDRRMEWFGRLDSQKALNALVKLVNGTGGRKLPPSLAQRRSSKRSGRPPR